MIRLSSSRFSGVRVRAVRLGALRGVVFGDHRALATFYL